MQHVFVILNWYVLVCYKLKCVFFFFYPTRKRKKEGKKFPKKDKSDSDWMFWFLGWDEK